jgi:hypothetical protein
MENKKLKLETMQDIDDLVNEIINENDGRNIGIFMSLLAFKYIKCFGLTKEQYFESLENSLNKLENY